MTSIEEEKRCPLCAEEMDWTDQQFNPCQCGYQVCVWCWHHIIDMAEKDEIEGRCPACRIIYDKDKIAAMQTNCGRTVTKNPNRKHKPPKAKIKTNEQKKDLTNIRVIQRKMVYVIGLPLNPADEDLLQRREYFGQYGKIDKVSLSRTTGGTIQQFINETCSVYITYSKEEEAVRCIQAVHGFVLEGRYLRASFGTAKYCHAWLKNIPCNNPACLYLHSIGTDEDSFGKDEVAAVHTRSRVQQIVGAVDNVVTRSGDVLPAPLDDMYSISSALTDKFASRNAVADPAHEFVKSKGEMNAVLSSLDKQGDFSGPQKMTSFVDIVGRSNCLVSQKDESIHEDRILNLCSDLSLVAMSKDTHAGQPYSDPNISRVTSSNQIENGFCTTIPDDSLREDSLLFENQGYKDTHYPSEMSFYLHQPFPANLSEESCGPALFRKKTHSCNDFNVVHDALYNHETEATLPIRCVTSVLNDTWQDMKFQNSSKSDRIYRSSSSFSNEEIVEHLRRIDDSNLNDGGESVGLETVENTIISNILSLDFDPWEESLTKNHKSSELLDETRGLHGSSRNTLNGDQSRYSYFNSNGFADQVNGPVFQDFGDNKEQYLQNTHYTARNPSLASTGFIVSSRDPPPGFSTCERAGGLPRVSSGNPLVNISLSSSSPQMLSTEFCSSMDINLAMPGDSKVKSVNMQKSQSFELGGVGTSQSTIYEDDTRLWLMMQQQTASAPQDSNFSRLFVPPQTQSNYPNHTVNGLSLDNIYGLSSRLVDQNQHYGPSSFTQLSQQKYGRGHISNTNGYHFPSFDKFGYENDLGMTEIGRNERLGLNKYFRGYGDIMFSSGDV